MELTINKECLMRLINLAIATEKRTQAKKMSKYTTGVEFENKIQKILRLTLKNTIKDFNIRVEDFSVAVLNLQGVFRWFSQYNFRRLKAVQNIKLAMNNVSGDYYRELAMNNLSVDYDMDYDMELVLSLDTFKATTLCKSAECQAKKEKEERLQSLKRYKKELSKPPVQYNKMNDFVAYDDTLDFITSEKYIWQQRYEYIWQQKDINELVTEKHNRWIENAEHKLKEYKGYMQRFFSDDLHKEFIDDVFIAEIKSTEERLTKESEDSIKTVNEYFNMLKNEVETIFSSEASRLEFSMRMFFKFYSIWIRPNTRIRLNTFKDDVWDIKQMINSFDITLLTDEQIFDIWDKMQELLKVKKNKADVYTNEQRLEKTKELMALDIEYRKYEKYSIGCNLFSLIEKSDVEIDDEIARMHENIERDKQEKFAEEEFELKANVIMGVDFETKEPKQFKVAVGMLATINEDTYGDTYVVIDIDTTSNKIQVIDREQRLFWLDCKTIHDIDKYRLSLNGRITRNKILGDLLPHFIEQAENKGLYVIK